MGIQLGPFLLDEAGRTLVCGRENVQLQPRVFDLLVYLAHNQARVATKDELLDAIWPGVTVTDNSLQRAISILRSALRRGGLENAIRNFPGKGYRLCVDSVPSQDNAPIALEDSVCALATQAFSQHAWGESATLYEQADASAALGADDLERWGLALQCLGRPAAAIPPLVRAVAARAAAGQTMRAAAAAVTLATIHLERGEAGPAKGWLARAGDWAESLQDPTTTGLVLWMRARIAANEGEPRQALSLVEAAYESACKQGDVKVTVLSLAYRGFFRLSLGDTRGGYADQDHAATLALSSNVDPVTGGTLYCNILWASRMFGDWARADQWTLGYQNFCAESRMELTGACQLHRSEVLGIKGSLREALSRVQDSLVRLVNDAPWAIGDAQRVLGDIHAAIGNDDDALDAYDKAYTLGWCPEPGHAMLLLERGEADAACASLERSLIGNGWWTLQRHGVLQAHLALAAAHAGRHERALGLIADLTADADRWHMPSIHALTNETRAVIAAARADRDEALRFLHLARQLWSGIDGRVHAARLRLRIAGLQLEVGDIRGARTELFAADRAAEELQSRNLQEACRGIQQRIEDKARNPAPVRG